MPDAPLSADSVTPVSPGMLQMAMQRLGGAVKALRGQPDSVRVDGQLIVGGDPYDALKTPPPNPMRADPPPGGRGSDPFAVQPWGPGHPFLANPTTAFQLYGRTWDFLQGINLNYSPKQGEGLPYPMIRALADADYLLRYCINTREDQLCALPWSIQSRNAKQNDQQDKGAADLERRWRIPGQPDSVFGRKPFSSAFRQALEDSLVIDSPMLTKWETRGGEVHRVNVNDGAPVKPLTDVLGEIPEPPLPAYQYIIKGYPGYELTQDQAIWMPKNVRKGKQYGYSLTEQCLMLINIALRRDALMLEYFKSGNLANTYFHIPKEWTTAQTQAFMELYDSRLAGNLAERQKVQWLPEVTGQSVTETKGQAINSPFDEWRARVYCAVWSLPYAPFVGMVNRGTASDARDEAMQEGLIPMALFYEEMWNLVLTVFFGRPDLCFKFNLKGETNPAVRAEADAKDRDGLVAANEQRELRGLPPIEGGDVVMVKTTAGWLPLSEAGKATFDKPTGGVDPALATQPGGKEPGGKPAKDGGNPDDAEPAGSTKRKHGPRFKAPHNPALAPAISHFAMTVHEKLHTVGQHASQHCMKHFYHKDAKAEGMSEADFKRIADSVDLSGLHGLIGPAHDAIAHVGKSSATVNLSALRAHRKVAKGRGEDEGIVKADARVVEYAKTRSAEMVTQISDATRDDIRVALTKAFEEGMYPDELVGYLQGIDSFSESRARGIADYEMSAANEEGTMAAWRASGQVAGKEWDTSEDPNVCELCQENADAGVVAFDDVFPSGHMNPPGHPGGCRCAVVAVLSEEADA